MNLSPLAIAIGAVRLWTALYTVGLPAAQRDARRGEIDSDLWESANDPAADRRQATLSIVMRLVRGMADDVAWRQEQEAPVSGTRIATMVLGAGCGAFALWLGVTSGRVDHPVLPPVPRPMIRAGASLPPPPPPVPPPSRPDRADETVVFKYGRTSYSALGNGLLPRKIKDVPPVHPPIAVAARVNGTIVLDAVIDEAGRVRDAHVVESIPLLDQAAVDAVRQWLFEAPRLDGAPRSTTIRILVQFDGAT